MIALMGIIFNNGRTYGQISVQLGDLIDRMKGFSNFEVNSRCWNESIKSRVFKIERRLDPPASGILDKEVENG